MDLLGIYTRLICRVVFVPPLVSFQQHNRKHDDSRNTPKVLDAKSINSSISCHYKTSLTFAYNTCSSFLKSQQSNRLQSCILPYYILALVSLVAQMRDLETHGTRHQTFQQVSFFQDKPLSIRQPFSPWFIRALTNLYHICHYTCDEQPEVLLYNSADGPGQALSYHEKVWVNP